MAKQNPTNQFKMTSGAIPMKSSDGRKYKVRNPSPHDFTADPTLAGRIVAFGDLNVDGDTRRFCVIESESALSQVFESKALEDLFKLGAVGDHVKLVYQGEKDLGGGRTFKRFSVEIWSE